MLGGRNPRRQDRNPEGRDRVPEGWDCKTQARDRDPKAVDCDPSVQIGGSVESWVGSSSQFGSGLKDFKPDFSADPDRMSCVPGYLIRYLLQFWLIDYVSPIASIYRTDEKL